eukprot:6197125-Pleurochrysis_carterae.AAC.6
MDMGRARRACADCAPQDVAALAQKSVEERDEAVHVGGGLVLAFQEMHGLEPRVVVHKDK